MTFALDRASPIGNPRRTPSGVGGVFEPTAVAAWQYDTGRHQP